MFTIARSVVLLSAVAAAALVVAFETSGRAANPPASAQVAQRFPVTSEIFTPVPVTYYVAQKFIAAQNAKQKAQRPSSTGSCASTPNGWPYVSMECRVAADATRAPVRG